MEKIVISRLIPKDKSILNYTIGPNPDSEPFPNPIRPAAIWAIGKIYAGQDLPEKYSSALIARLNDETPMSPESEYVKTMCAFTFGATKTDVALESLRKFARKSGRNSRLGFHCLWAIRELTSEPIPPEIESKKSENRWFLRPLK